MLNLSIKASNKSCLRCLQSFLLNRNAALHLMPDTLVYLESADDL